jgi:hypothetical protein
MDVFGRPDRSGEMTIVQGEKGHMSRYEINKEASEEASLGFQIESLTKQQSVCARLRRLRGGLFRAGTESWAQG